MKGSFVGVDIALSSQLQGQDENISASQFFTLENLESSDMDDPSLGLGQSFLPDSSEQIEVISGICVKQAG